MVNLTSGGLSGGYRKYLRRIVPMLRADARVERLDVHNPPAVRDLVEDAFTWPAKDGRRGFPTLRANLRASGADVLFFPTARMLDGDGTPTVVMVRNMEPLATPWAGNSWLDRARNLARRGEAHRSARRASRVIAVSNYVRDFLIAEWSIEAGRIAVVRHGVDAAIRDRDAESVESIERALASPSSGKLLFTAGSIRPARGLTDLVETLPLLADRGLVATLVVAGAVDHGAEHHWRALRARVAELGLASHVIWAGSLDERRMAWCYRRCDAFVMTSRVEACPNIALEAMSYGATCVSGDNAPMPEFFGDAARYYRSGDPSSLADTLAGVLDGSPRVGSDAFREAALQRAAQFTWRETVDRTIRELQTAAGMRGAT